MRLAVLVVALVATASVSSCGDGKPPVRTDTERRVAVTMLDGTRCSVDGEPVPCTDVGTRIEGKYAGENPVIVVCPAKTASGPEAMVVMTALGNASYSRVGFGLQCSNSPP